MKPLVPVLVLAMAVPVFGQETAATTAPPAGSTASAPVKKAPPKDLSTPAGESPLVAAANRNKNKKRDKKVITNETLKEMNQGRITTTNTQAELPVPAAETEEQKAAKTVSKAQQDAKAADEKKAADKKKADEQRAQSQAQRAAVLEEELYLDADELPPSALQEGEAAPPAKP